MNSLKLNKIISFGIIFSVSIFANTLQASVLDSLRIEKSNNRNFVLHKVDKGQTLFGILRKYGSNLSEFKATNPNIDTDIQINQILKIPYNKPIVTKAIQKNTAIGQADAVVYAVEAGMTLVKIAKKYQTTVAELKRINALESDIIEIGQEIIVKEGRQPEIVTPVSNDPNVYLVEKGMTLSKIAIRYKTTVAELRRLNNLETDTIEINQEIIVKEGGSKSAGVQQTYLVESGMTLFKIAKRFNTTVAELRRMNNLVTDTIEIDQELIVKEGTVPPEKPNYTTVPKVEEKEKEINVVQKEKLPEANKVDNPIKTEPIRKPEVVEAEKPKVVEVVKPAVVEVVKAKTTEVVPVKKDTVKLKTFPEPKKEEEVTTNKTDEDNAPRVVKVEEGVAELIAVESKSGKYLALHKSAPIGTLIQVKNETNGASVWVKVIGRLPEVEQNENVVIKLSPKAMDRVSPVDKRFRAKLNYSM